MSNARHTPIIVRTAGMPALGAGARAPIVRCILAEHVVDCGPTMREQEPEGRASLSYRPRLKRDFSAQQMAVFYEVAGTLATILVGAFVIGYGIWSAFVDPFSH